MSFVGDYFSFQNGYAFRSSDFVTKGKYRVVKIKELKDGLVKFFDDTAEINLPDDFDAEKYIIRKGDVLFALTGDPVNKPNPLSWVGRVAYYNHDEPALLNQRVCKAIPKGDIPSAFLYYFFRQDNEFFSLASKATGSASQANISTKTIEQHVMNIPDKSRVDKIVGLMNDIDEKIINNALINRNLSEQLKSIFVESFGQEISNTKIGEGVALSKLINVIDNRGKTPPLTTDTTEYPIIDVGALRGDIRVVDFNNCTKFVDEDTYNNWFRSGHPKPWDILLSTVGSLAEMKIFLGQKGCIAQNVVALRSKGISPLYLFQYLQYIRNDLVAYNIGSVQPSIKVTHIIKHAIFVPEENRIKEFDKLARTITDHIYKLYCECEDLKGIRDSLLPKLMSGELDVSEVEL